MSAHRSRFTKEAGHAAPGSTLRMAGLLVTLYCSELYGSQAWAFR